MDSCERDFRNKRKGTTTNMKRTESLRWSLQTEELEEAIPGHKDIKILEGGTN